MLGISGPPYDTLEEVGLLQFVPPLEALCCSCRLFPLTAVLHGASMVQVIGSRGPRAQNERQDGEDKGWRPLTGSLKEWGVGYEQVPHKRHRTLTRTTP